MAAHTTRLMPVPRPRISAIQKSLEDMTIEELQEMSDDLTELIQVLITRQVAVEDVITGRLEEAFAL